MKKDYLSYISIGTGSSWGYGETPVEAVSNMLISLKDWTRYYNLSEELVMSHIYNVTEYEGFSADHRGLYGCIDDGKYTDEPLTPVTWAISVTPKFASKTNRTWSELKACRSALRTQFFSSYEEARNIIETEEDTA